MAHPSAYALQEEYYTFADYLEWDEGERVELIEGVPYLMATPAPAHQNIAAGLTAQLYDFLRGKPCRVYPAPFTVRLFEEREDEPEDVETVLEPDISVVCDREKIDGRGCRGAPDLIVEILSPSTRRYDRFRKFHLYQRAGVREYWIADPEAETVTPFVLQGGRYAEGAPSGERLASAVLDGFTADLRSVFEEW